MSEQLPPMLQYVPYVNSNLTVKLATTLFLFENDTVSRDTLTHTQYIPHIKIKFLPTSLSGLSLHTVCILPDLYKPKLSQTKFDATNYSFACK